ncbi:MAG: DUF2764 family protein [Porphyromonas sp.]|nr:DUF2764 family protein [Porphyromonas sp.]
MAHYYTLGAELPGLKQEQTSLSYSSLELWEGMMRPQFSKKDIRQMELLFLQEDNKTLIRLLKGLPVEAPTVPVALGEETLATLIRAVDERRDEENDEPTPIPDNVPEYMVRFVRDYLDGKFDQDASKGFAEDFLAVAYYDHIRKKAIGFVKKWVDLNARIANITAATTAKKFGLDISSYLVGDSSLTEILRLSSWADLQFLPESDLLQEIVRVSEESNLYLKERHLDTIRWKFLEEVVFSDTFSIEAMMVYFLKTRIIERWTTLDKEQGEAAFRSLISHLNSDGKQKLANFIESTKSKSKNSANNQQTETV